jgi:serine/threonine-protein kinase
LRVVLVVLTLLSPVSALAQQFLGPYQPNAYGPGINSDATGRPFTWQPSPGSDPADPLSRVSPDAYGPGIGMDQYGRPVQPAPYPGRGSGQSEPQQNQKFGAIAFSQGSGAVGYSYDYVSSEDADRSALNSCGHDCNVVVWFSNACGALAVGAGRGYGATWAGSQLEAENMAMSRCGANTTNCDIVRWVCTSR